MNISRLFLFDCNDDSVLAELPAQTSHIIICKTSNESDLFILLCLYTTRPNVSIGYVKYSDRPSATLEEGDFGGPAWVNIDDGRRL